MLYNEIRICRLYIQLVPMQHTIMDSILTVFLLVNIYSLFLLLLLFYVCCIICSFVAIVTLLLISSPFFFPFFLCVWLAEAFIGKGLFKKRLSYHAKGKCGIRVRPECRLTVVIREITPEEEAEIAKLKVNNFRKLSKREKRLVPHKLIETTPIWDRKSKTRSQESGAMPA